jgi:hypothetical protein
MLQEKFILSILINLYAFKDNINKAKELRYFTNKQYSEIIIKINQLERKVEYICDQIIKSSNYVILKNIAISAVKQNLIYSDNINQCLHDMFLHYSIIVSEIQKSKSASYITWCILSKFPIQFIKKIKQPMKNSKHFQYQNCLKAIESSPINRIDESIIRHYFNL